MYEWDESEAAVQLAIRAFVDKEIRPLRHELEFGTLPPYDVLAKLWKAFGIDAMASDWFEKSLDSTAREESRSDDENSDSFLGMAVILLSELSRVSPGLVAVIGGSLGLAANTILARGSEEQKRRWVPGLLTWDTVGAWGLTEPGSGSDAFGAMNSTVRAQGEGYVLNGSKTFITNAPSADTIVVFAKLDDGVTPPAKRRVLTFVLDAGMDGLSQGQPLEKMGCHSSPTGELFFDDVHVGPDRLLGGEKSGTSGGAEGDERAGAKAVFVAERVGLAASALGIIEECLDRSVRYSNERVQFGKPIGDFQLIQQKLAMMEVARQNVQNMLFRAVAMSKDRKQVTLAEASAMKLYASEMASNVAMEAVQLFGGHGYMAENVVEQLARDAKLLMIFSGSNEIQTTQIARDLLRQGARAAVSA